MHSRLHHCKLRRMRGGHVQIDNWFGSMHIVSDAGHLERCQHPAVAMLLPGFVLWNSFDWRQLQ